MPSSLAFAVWITSVPYVSVVPLLCVFAELSLTVPPDSGGARVLIATTFLPVYFCVTFVVVPAGGLIVYVVADAPHAMHTANIAQSALEQLIVNCLFIMETVPFLRMWIL